MFLTYNLADVGNVVAGGHEVGEVVEFQLIVTTRDDGIAASLDGYHVVRVVGTADVLERLVEDFASLTQLDAEHHEGAVVHIPALAHPTHLESIVDIYGSKHLWIDELADTEFLEEFLCLRFHVFRIIHTCHGALGTEILGKDAGGDVGTLHRGDRDEEIRILNTGIPQGLQTGRFSYHGEQIAVGADACQALFAFIDECNLLLAARQESRQVGTDGIGASYDDFHIDEYLNFDALFSDNGILDALVVEMYNLAQLFYGAMLHKFVWQSQAGYLWLIAVVAHPFEYGRAHSAHSYTIFYGHDALELLAHLGEDVFIQRLHKSHIVVRNAHLRFLLYLFDCLDGIVSDRTDGEHGYIFSVFQLSAGTGLDFLHLVAPIYKHTAATRITDHVASVVWQLG